jgi:cytosine permease
MILDDRFFRKIRNIRESFFLAVGVGIFQLLSKHSIVDLMGSAPAGKPLTLGVAATMVAGGFIIGAVITPDFSRFAKS